MHALKGENDTSRLLARVSVTLVEKFFKVSVLTLVLHSLSMEFLVKAQRALKSGDESLAKEALQLKRAQTEASHDVLLHVDMEKKVREGER